MRLSQKLSPAQRIYLDFLRAAAANAVLLGHAAHLFLVDSPLDNSHIEDAGVLIFFIISGFLITYSVLQKLENATYSFREFLIDRFSRIYCAFLPALLFVKIIDSFTIRLPLSPSSRISELTWISGMRAHQDWYTFFGNLFMLQDFPLFQILRRLGFHNSCFFLTNFGSGIPFWTISIEWWIYMLFGFIVIVLIRNRKRVSFVIICILGLLLISPCYYAMGGPIACLTLLWIIGMLSAFCLIKLPILLTKSDVLISSVANQKIWGVALFLSILFMSGRLMAIHTDVGKYAFQELQFGVFLALFIFSGLFFFGHSKNVPFLIDKPISFMASYSYSLYLVHAPIMTCLYLRFPGNDSSCTFYWSTILVCNIIAIMFWFFFERHYRAVAVCFKEMTKSLIRPSSDAIQPFPK
jgi:peptidoglycan/LPS O-acetylase OafA/YrhL